MIAIAIAIVPSIPGTSTRRAATTATTTSSPGRGMRLHQSMNELYNDLPYLMINGQGIGCGCRLVGQTLGAQW